MKKQYILLVVLILSRIIPAISGNGEISGTVIDTLSLQPLSGVTVHVIGKSGEFKFSTNDAGIYYANNLPSGTYTVKAFVNKNIFIISEVVVFPDKSTLLDIQANTLIGEVAIEHRRKYIEPIFIDPGDPGEIYETKAEDIENAGLKSIEEISALNPSFTVIDDEIHSSGARAGNTGIEIDGMRIIGSSSLISGSISYFRGYAGGLPAKYGDVSGGLIVVETKSYFDN